MKVIYLDSETRSLDVTSTLWCVCTIDVETGERKAFTHMGVYGTGSLNSLQAELDSADIIIGHNVLAFDYHVLRHHYDVDIHKFIDTLIMAQVLDPSQDNSLDALGKRLCNKAKTEFDDFSKLTQKMVDYCMDDCVLGLEIYNRLKDKLVGQEDAVDLEHDLQYILEKQRINGLPIDEVELRQLKEHLDLRQKHLDQSIQICFPPIVKEEIFIPKVNRPALGYVKGVPFIKTETIPFNMNSNKQVIDKLDQYGWKPYVKTKGHIKIEKELRKGKPVDAVKLADFKKYGWQLNEENLATIPDTAPPEIQLIPEYKMLTSRRGLINNYLDNLGVDRRIHGICRGLGATTHRGSHKDPNLANVPGKKSPYGKEFRSLVRAEPGKVFVGTDADAIQLRILAHLMDDPDYIQTVCEGTEDEGTDVHSVNARILGVDRDTAKTFIYAFALNAGIPKLAQILGCSVGQARQKYEHFLDSLPALRELKQQWVPAQARQGYILGPDGRRMVVNNEHFVLATALQGFEKIIMAKANIIWDHQLSIAKTEYKQVAFVHDEWLTETLPASAKYVGESQCVGLYQSGLELGIKARIAGSYRIGDNWYEVH